MLRAACLLGLLAPAFAAAQLVSELPIHHAGTVKGGVALSHTYELHNAGKEPLEITDVRTGCGCLVARPDRRTFAPGEKGAIRLDVHTVTQAPGPNVWGAEVSYRAGGRDGVLNLRLTAHVAADLQVRPATLVMHTAAVMTHPFTLVERREKPVTLTSATTSSPHVRAEASEPLRQGAGWTRTIRLVVLPTCPEGRHSCTLSLLIDDPASPELRVPFTVIKKSADAVEATPSALQWDADAGEALPARMAVLHGTDAKPVVIEEVTVSHPAVRATWASGPRATLRFVVDRDQVPAGGLEATADVRLSSPAATSVRIPLTVRLR